MHETDPKTKERSRRVRHGLEYYRDRGAEKPLFRRQLTDKIGGNETIQGYDGELYWQKLGQTRRPRAPRTGIEGRTWTASRARSTAPATTSASSSSRTSRDPT